MRVPGAIATIRGVLRVYGGLGSAIRVQGLGWAMVWGQGSRLSISNDVL